MMHSDTIFALSTGGGMAGIAVIRASGPAAGLLLDSIAGGRPPPRLASLRLLRDPVSEDVIDQGLVLWMPAPGSATGEDVAEFHVHGSAAVADGLFAAFRQFPDVRLAEPGEFTRRAFANGCMDLVEVEGLADLLRARTVLQRRQAVHHLLGEASSVFETWRAELVGILAHVEATVDFAEEEGVAEAALRDIRPRISALVDAMSAELAIAEQARGLREGVRIVLAGRPNTGKSSLLNAIARRDAAIVSARPGTTRDVIEVQIDLDGMPVILMDTAGLRERPQDDIEIIGIERTRKEVGRADIVVWVSAPDVPGSYAIDGGVAVELRVQSKSDLDGEAVPEAGASAGLAVSARTGAGLPELLRAMSGLVSSRYAKAESAVIVRRRQQDAIADSIRFLNDSLRHDLHRLELAAEDLRNAGDCLGRVTGRIDVEDLLSSIFSEFCIGK